MKKPLFSLFLPVALALLFLPQTVLSQSQRAAEANRAAYELYMQGNYEEAREAYQQLIKDYATDLLVPVATVQMGFADFFLGNFDSSIAILENAMTDETVPSELLPAIAGFIPQVYAAKAAAMDPDEEGRRAAFETAIERFTKYLENYPGGDQIESVTYGRALAKYQIEDFDGAVQDLEANMRNFPQSPTVQDSENLLALTLATIGSRELRKGEEGDRAKGQALYNRAKSLLKGIIDRQTNLVLVNDARFQLAEILFSEAAFAPEDERPELYAQAMEAYRAVAPNEEMIAMQEEVLAGFPERMRRVMTNIPARRNLERELAREQRRLGELMGKSDMISTAGLKMGEIYFSKNDLNKARVVLRHIRPFLEKEEDQKRALYFLTLSYILQNVEDRALEHYDLFMEHYKGAPIGQNLPIGMGNMYLNHPNPAVRDANKAIQYYDESLEIYPDGPFAGLTTVTKAGAQVSLGQTEEAKKTFEAFLEGNPSPDEALVARVGLGDIYIRTRQWDKAIEAYQNVIDQFAGRPQQADAEYWIAVATQQKGDHAAAIPLLQEVIEKYPDNSFTPNAIYALAGSQVPTGDTDGALATLEDLAERFPDSPPAPSSYFLRSQLLATQGKIEESDQPMRDFIERYPEAETLYNAYDWIAQNAYRAGNWEEALDKYQAYVDQNPHSAKAASALLRIADISRQWAESLGRFAALSTDERTVWQERLDRSLKAAEMLVGQYSDSQELPLGIQSMMSTQQLLVGADLKSANAVEAFMQTLADRSGSFETRSKILFGLSSWVAGSDPERALLIMQEAYDPDVVYAPADLDIYATGLLGAGNIEGAEAVFQKLQQDYPNPPGVEPNAAPPLIQHAQAISMFGIGRVAQEREQTAEAAEYFRRLKELYPWSPKVLEAEIGILEAEFAAGGLDEVQARIPGLIRHPNATADIRAKAMHLGGKIMKKRYETATDPQEKDRHLAAAIDYFIKIDYNYEGVPAIAASGLWEGGQLLELHAAAATDPDFRKRQLNEARNAYRDLIKKYPNSPYVDEAQRRLAALGG